MVALADLNQPYSCTQWGNVPDGGAAQIIEDTSSQIWSFFETGSAVPSTVWIDHEMRVYDTMNNAGSWAIGSRIDQMLEACGSLCEGDGGCSLAAGDVNEDEILNIQDIIAMVNQILGSATLTDCALEAADMTMDGIVNIQDLISLVNAILGNARSAQLDGHAGVTYVSSGEDMVLYIDSDVEIAGIQLSFFNDIPIDIKLKDNSHISEESNYTDGINRYLAYSIFNDPFDSKTPEILIQSASGLSLDDIEIIVADINGDALSLSKQQGKEVNHPNSFEISKLYPNPFNPSTQISFSLPMEGHVRLTAYDVRGQEVGVIFEGSQNMGNHSYTWHASDLPSGLYYVRLQSGALVTTKKALLIK